MNSLEELNQFGNEEFEYPDQRPANVIFDRFTPTDLSFEIFEGQALPLPNGTEIVQIINYDLVDVSLTVDITQIQGAVIQWPVVPDVCTVTNPSPGIFTISGFRSKSQWDLIKNPILALDNIWFGQGNIVVTIQFNRGFTVQTVVYNIFTDVIEVNALSVPTTFNYTGTTATPFLGVPNLIDEGTLPGSIWNLTMTPSNPRSLTNITTIGTGGTFNYNSVTQVTTISGTQEEINNRLNGLRFTPAIRKEYTWNMTYFAVNTVTSESDTKVQTINSNITTFLANNRGNPTFSPNVSANISLGPQITHESYTLPNPYTMEVFPFVSSDVTVMSGLNAVVDYNQIASTTIAGSAPVVSLNGEIGVVGLPTFNSNKGRVVVYSINNGVWTFLQEINGTVSEASEQFGFAVAISENANRLVVSAPAANIGTANSRRGLIYVYNRVDGVYQLSTTLLNSNTSPNSRVGTRLRISANGNYIIASALGDTSLNQNTQGIINVWRFVSGTTWADSRIFEPTQLNGNAFGNEIEINDTGTHLFVTTGGDKKLYLYFRSSTSFDLQSNSTISDPICSKISIDKTGSLLVIDRKVYTRSGSSLTNITDIYPEDLRETVSPTSGSSQKIVVSPDGNFLMVPVNFSISTPLSGGFSLLRRQQNTFVFQKEISSNNTFFPNSPNNFSISPVAVTNDNTVYVTYIGPVVRAFVPNFSATALERNYRWNRGQASSDIVGNNRQARMSKNGLFAVVENKVYTISNNVYTLQHTLPYSQQVANPDTTSWSPRVSAIDAAGNTLAVWGRYSVSDIPAGTSTPFSRVVFYHKENNVWVEKNNFDLNFFLFDAERMSMADDGNTFAINVSTFSGNNETGRVRIYSRSNDVWTQQANFTSSDIAINDGFGRSLDLSANGSILIVGAPLKPEGSNNLAGRFYIFTRSGGVWTQRANILPPGGGSNGWGYGVAISGNGGTIAVSGFSKLNLYTGSVSTWTLRSTYDAWPNVTSGLNLDLNFDGSSLVASCPFCRRVIQPSQSNSTSNPGIFRAGLAMFFKIVNNNLYYQGRFFGPSEESQFGLTATISSDGNTIFVTSNPNGAFGIINFTTFRKTFFGSKWNNSTKTLTITGLKAEVNLLVDNIKLTSPSAQSFDLIYKVTTPTNTVVERNQKIIRN